jgi:probable HAF family extracellular repeat protein
VIVGGNAGNGPQRHKAYRWSEERGGEIIGMLPNDDPLAGAYAFAVSDDGRVVGGASGAEGREAFVWTRTTGIFKFQDYLADLGVQGLDDWTLDTILAISSDGTTIAGWGYWGPGPFGRVQGWVVDGLPPFVDTDADSVLDAVDNCTLLPNADRRDTDGDLYGNRCDPDFDNDGIVDRDDVDYLRSVVGTADPDGDLDGDGIVGPRDAVILRNFLGEPPGPSGRVQ